MGTVGSLTMSAPGAQRRACSSGRCSTSSSSALQRALWAAEASPLSSSPLSPLPPAALMCDVIPPEKDPGLTLFSTLFDRAEAHPGVCYLHGGESRADSLVFPLRADSTRADLRADCASEEVAEWAPPSRTRLPLLAHRYPPARQPACTQPRDLGA